MASSHDTEITLGTGKILGIFFGLVALCALFFGLGYKLGRNSVATVEKGEVPAPVVSTSGVRPSAVKNNSATPAADVAFYKTNTAKASPAQADSTPPSSDDAATAKPANDTAQGAPQGGYFVQVAAVSKQEDGEALVDALKKKQYPAFASSGPDKLFHIQVGPFPDIKSAEDMRAKLVSDGYNPILKK